MSAILRWFHDGDVRYRAYFRTSDEVPAIRQLIVASSDGEAVDVVEGNRQLEDFSYTELLAYAKRLRLQMQAHSETAAMDAAAD